MLGSLLKAIGQFHDPAFRRVVLLGVAGALLLYLLLAVGASLLIWKTALFETGWAEWSIDLLGWAAAIFLPILLFPAFIGLFIGLFLDDVAAAVEARHYPTLPPPRRVGVLETMQGAVRFLLTVASLNLLALVTIYWIPGINVIAFYSLNGYLLGREYLEMVATRRIEPLAARALRQAYSGRWWLDGMVIAFFLSIPFVNLIAPVLGCAFMVHEFERLRRKRGYV